MKQVTFLSFATLAAAICGAGDARASLSCPDGAGCSVQGPILTIQNTRSSNGTGIDASTAGTGYGVYAYANGNPSQGPTGGSAGLVGESNSGIGVYGYSAGGQGAGVSGFGTSFGVFGTTNSSGADGVRGVATGNSANNGVSGISNNAYASGVYGETDFGGYGTFGRVQPAGNGYAIYGDNNSTETGAWAGFFHGSVNITGSLTVSGTCTASCSSDIRLKKNVQSLTGSLDQLVKLRPVTYEWKQPEEHGGRTGVQRGFIAQEVEKVMPEWVGEDDRGFKTLTLSGLEPMVVESLRTLKLENDVLRDRVKALEGGGRTSIAGFAEGGLIGIAGLVVTGSALVVLRRKRSDIRA